jgi:sugar phosphate isomerase/epimerase
MSIRSSIAIGAVLFTVAAASIAAEPARERVKVDTTRHWKGHHFAMTNWFYKHKWSDPAEQIRILAEAGYQGVKLSLKDDPGRWKMLPAYLKALKEHDIKLTAIHCRFYLEDGTYPQVIKDNLPLLKDSGVILVPSVGSRKKADRRDPAAVESAVKILREMSDDAQRFGLGGITPYMHINNWAETIDDCLFLAEKVDRDNVGVMFHLHHWTAVTQREAGASFRVDQTALREALERAKPYLMLVVIQGQDNNAATHKIVGEGDFDLRPLVRILADLNYEGPLGSMGYTQSGDIPGKLGRAQKGWIKIRDEATAPDYKPDAAKAPADKPAEKKPAVMPATKPNGATIKGVRASGSLKG